MRTFDTDIIEKIFLLNNKLIKYGEKHIFTGSGLTPSQFNILGEIILNKEIGLNKLKNKLIISSPALSQMINRMEKSGLLKRNIGKNDKREILIKPTEKAKKLYEDLDKKYITLSSNKFENIKESDKQKLIELLDKLEKIIL